MPHFDVIAFDADDTLWHNERLYANAEKRFANLLAQYHPAEWIQEKLDETESRNIQHFGYGIKSFILSMIETSVELTEGRVSGQDIQAILDIAKEMLSAPVDLLPHVAETIPLLAQKHRLIMITKGDLLDQESKVARSGLGAYFQAVEVVSQKERADYAQVLKRIAVQPENFIMIGNSLRSDVCPVLELGGYAVYVPYEITWQHEASDPPPPDQQRYHAIQHMGELLALLEKIDTG
jgi:putative hydrolase of the HAD superfamily